MSRVNGLKLHHRVDGDGGPWLTLITGIANDLTLWDAQVPALAEDFRVLRYDLRGQGGSESTPPPYTVALLAEDLLRLWRTLGIERSHLVGLGLGGAIAQAIAIEHGAMLSSVAPCCCRARMVPDFAAMWHGLAEQVRSGGVDSIAEATAQRWFTSEFKAANPGVLEDVRRMIRRTSRDGYLGCVAAFLGLDLEDSLHRIETPLLYISGAEDRLGGPPQLMAGLAARVRGARHVSVPDAAHIANIQNAPGFNRVLVEFLEEHR